MPFQKQVQIGLAPGVPGGAYSLNQEVTTVKLAAYAALIASFVWLDPAKDQVKNAGTGKPLGLAVRTRVDAQLQFGEEASQTVKAGDPVTVAIKGEYYVLANTQAVIGQAVFANTTTGAISTATPGATVAGCVETDWRVITSAPAGQPFAISAWR